MNGVLNENENLIFGERKNYLFSIWEVLFGDIYKEWIGFKPSLGAYVYPCYACRHLFSTLSSLRDHVNRRILILKYNCSVCKDDQFTFYNRCALLLHARSHFTLNEGHLNLCEITTSTLPLHLAGFLPIPQVPTIYYDNDEVPLNENTYMNVQFYSPCLSEKGKQIIKLKPSDFIFKEINQTLALKQLCKNIPKCKFITVDEQENLKRSLLESDSENVSANIKVELFDYIDQITLPVISKVESLHLNNYNSPQCVECHSIQNGTMLDHYQGSNKPTDLSLTCTVCKFIAPTKCSYQAHIRIHNNEGPHVCPDCGKDFKDSVTLQDHLNEVCFHLAKNVKFRCIGKRCGKLFASEFNLALHFKQHFQCVYTCTVCSSTFFDNNDVEKHYMFHNGHCTFLTVYNCTVCTLKTLNQAEVKSHIENHTIGTKTGVYVYMCRNCRSYFRSTATFAAHSLKCVNRQCIENGINGDCDKCKTSSELKKSCSCPKSKKLSVKKVKLTKRYFCILCNEQIDILDKVSHMKNCRYAYPVVLIHRSTDLRFKEFSESPSRYSLYRDIRRSLRNSDSPKSDESVKKKKKKNLTLRPRRTDRDTKPDLTAENPIEFDGTYYCKLCDYRNNLRSEFHEHIRTHRDISTAYQCMECGECFVVKPSLRKHLLHYHNISDYQSYLAENDCYDVNAVKELENSMRLAPGEKKEHLKENQCSVCLAVFEDSISLNKHYRGHGMAFLLKNVK